MTRSSRISSIVALATALALAFAFAWALPGVAAAQPGDRTFEETFPTAGAICAKIAAGTENRRLKAAATQASTACSTLEGEFKSAQSAVLTARSTLTPEIEAARSGAATSCPAGPVTPAPAPESTPEQTPESTPGGASPATLAGCLSARRQSRASIPLLAAQLHAAYRGYFTSVFHAREAFLAAINAIERNAIPGPRHAIHTSPRG